MEGNVLFIDAHITFLLTVQTYGKEPLRGPKSRGPPPSSKIDIYIYIYIYIYIDIYIYIYIYIIYRHVGRGGRGGGRIYVTKGPKLF